MGEVKRVWAVNEEASLFDRLLFYRCLKAYDFAKPLVAGQRVLEIGCGTCYGLDHFDATFAQYVGMDIDAPLLESLVGHYAQSDPPISFLCADINRAPLPAHTFDVVISFQVIEHLPHPAEFLRLAAHLVKSGGHMILTTPNRAVRLLPFQKPWNPEHIHEYSYREFRRLLHGEFAHANFYSVCGDAFSFEMERRRVKQDPYQVYLRRPLGAVARRLLPDQLKATLRQRRQAPLATSLPNTETSLENSATVSLENYVVCEGDAPRGLDFLAVITL